MAALRSTLLGTVCPALCEQQSQRLLFTLARPFASTFPPTSTSCLPASRLSPLSSSAVRHHSTLPVQQHYIPRVYPFPVILTTEFLAEDDVQLHRANPHDLPPYKSTLTANIHDLPLTAAEKRVFRHLVGARMYSHTMHTHPTPAFLTAHPRTNPNIPRQRRQRKAGSHVKVKFVSRHLPSAQANENRVFQLLDETIRQCKVLVEGMAADGQWVEEDGAEVALREVRRRIRREIEKEDREKAEAAAGGAKAVEGGEQVKMVSGESVGRAGERQAVPIEKAEEADKHL